jgi:adenylosuccinate lyase
MFDYTTYLSPFTWRYGSQDMRRLWSEYHKRRLWREIWLALAEAQAEYGLVSPEQLQDLQVHMDDIDVSRSLEIEARIKHDLMAELKAYAETSPLGGGALHMGATSTDIEDNADALRIRQSLNLILEELKGLVTRFARLSQQWADVPIMAFTHLQPAEPTTLGYRLAQYTQDLFEDWQRLSRLHQEMRGKGFRGAVGTSASFGELIGLENVQAFEEALSRKLDLPFYPVSTQVYPRKQDYLVVSALADLSTCGLCSRRRLAS